MTKDEIFNKVKEIIVDKLDIEDSASVKLSSTFRKDLGADSLDTYELIYAIEENFDITVPDDEANKFETVEDAVNYLEKNIKS